MQKKIFIEFKKTDSEKREVHGYATTEALDAHDEVVELSAIAKALPEYNKYKNIREMHSSSAVGVATKTSVDEKGLFIIAKIVDDNAWKKVREQVYKGFSIGGRVISMVKNRITDLTLDEISLVDRPANPEAVFSLYKRDNNNNNMPEEKKEKKEVESLKKQETQVIEASKEHEKEAPEMAIDVEPKDPVKETEEKKEEKKEETEKKDTDEKKPKTKKFVDVSLKKSELDATIKSIVKDDLQKMQDRVSSLEEKLSKYEGEPSENKARASYVPVEKSTDPDNENGKDPEDLKKDLLKQLQEMSLDQVDKLDTKTKDILFNI